MSYQMFKAWMYLIFAWGWLGAGIIAVAAVLDIVRLLRRARGGTAIG